MFDNWVVETPPALTREPASVIVFFLVISIALDRWSIIALRLLLLFNSFADLQSGVDVVLRH